MMCLDTTSKGLTDGLHIGHINIYHLINKIHDVTLFINQQQPIHILGISETRLNQSKSDDLIDIAGYNVIRRDPEIQGHTGLATYIHHSVAHLVHRRQDLESKTVECMWFRVKLNKPVYVCVLYRNPASSFAWYDEFNEMFDKVDAAKNSVIVLGDFNIDLQKPHLAWESTMRIHGLKQLVQEPTRITPTTSTLLDHIYCNSSRNVVDVQTVQCGMSDHYPIMCTWLCKTHSKAKGEHVYVQYRSMKNFDVNAFLYDISTLNFSDVYQCSSSDDALTLWYKTFMPVINKHAPLKTRRVKHQTLPKWLTPEIINNMKERDACKKAKRFDEYKHLRNKVSAMVKEAKKQYFDEMLKNGNDTASLWRAMNAVTRKTQGKSTQNKTTPSPQTFNDYFINEVSSIITEADVDLTNSFTVPTKLRAFCENNRHYHSFTIPSMSVHEVGGYISNMKNKKSMGPDNISVYFLKLSLPYIVESLTFIFNLSISQNSFPAAFKEAKVIPIPKTKAPLEPKDFRPISLLSVLSKPLEKHVHKHLSAFLEEHNLLYIYQSGFRKHHSCQTALSALCDAWLDNINKLTLTGAVFLDLRKAFDLIDHEILIQKLDTYVKNSTVTDFMRSYLVNRSQYVHINGTSSSKDSIKCGVPQGSILGPLLFCIFINDLPLALEDSSVNCDMFADDNTLHTNGKTTDEIEVSLQIGLDCVQDWCRENKMVLHPEKTKSMIITTRQKHQRQNLELKLKLNSKCIEHVHEHKVLGVIIDDEMTWSSHISHVNKTLSRNLFLLYQLKHYVGTEARLSFYYAHILSHINYASNVWCGASANNLKLMQSLHRRAAKMILPDPALTTEEKQRQLGILTLDNQFIYNIAILMFKVRQNLAPTYLRGLLELPTSRYGSEKYILPLPRIDIFKHSFSFCGPSVWNSLPQSISQCQTLSTFKKRLHEFLCNF
jgi:exonuclease III